MAVFVMFYVINSIIMAICTGFLYPYFAIFYVLLSIVFTFFAYKSIPMLVAFNVDTFEEKYDIESKEYRQIVISCKFTVLALKIGAITVAFILFGMLAVIFIAMLIAFGYLFYGRKSSLSLNGFGYIFNIAKNLFFFFKNKIDSLNEKLVCFELRMCGAQIEEKK